MKCTCTTKEVKRYRHMVTVEQPLSTAVAGASGHIDWSSSANWTTYGKFKVNFLSRGGREGRVFDQIQAEVTHIAETRSTTASRAIDETMRVVFNSRNYNITVADDVNQARETVQLYLTEVK